MSLNNFSKKSCSKVCQVKNKAYLCNRNRETNGGLKEKLLAAHRGGIKTVLIPFENKRDLEEIPDNVIADLDIHPVKRIEEVLTLALQNEPSGMQVVTAK